jgi:2-dehydropantoate 2-reductase
VNAPPADPDRAPDAALGPVGAQPAPAANRDPKAARRPVPPTPKRRYAIVGTGAIGGYYGARLATAGHEVHFLARSDAEHLRDHGLRVESPFGDMHLRDVSVYTSADEIPPVDVVVLAVKTTDTEQAAKLLTPMVGDGTVVLVLQNGLNIEAAIAEAVPGTPVLGGMCFICSNKIAPGHVRHLDYGAVTVGEHTDHDSGGAGITAAVDAICFDLEEAGLPTQRVENLVTGRWRKLVWNIPYNGLSVVLDAGTDELMRDPVTRLLIEELMVEVLNAAEACGHYIELDFIDYMLRTTDKMRPYKTSMKLDFEAGRPLEIDAIYNAPARAARQAGYDMVRTEVLATQLQFLDARRRGVDLDRRPRAD